MTSFKFLSATLVLSALLATPASAQTFEPAAAASRDPSFSIYSNDGRGFSRSMAAQATLGDASGPYMPVRPHRGNRIAGVKRY